MKRHIFSKALMSGIAVSAAVLASCSTPQTRISGHPEMYQSLSPSDQALVNQGQIRVGMPRSPVWLAWGSADSKIVGNMRGRPTETWIYVNYTYPYYYPYAYPYPYGFGFGFAGGRYGYYGGRRFAFFGSPFYDPFFYSYIPPAIPYPYKVVTFSNGRVVSFQYLVPPYR